MDTVASVYPKSVAPAVSALALDTTRCSLLHRLTGTSTLRSVPLSRVSIAYGVSACVTYGLMLVAGGTGSGSLIVPHESVKLPFLRDWNTAFMFLVSFPALVLLTMCDQSAVAAALRRVQEDGVLTISDRDATDIRSRWERRFTVLNLAAQGVGLATGLTVACLNSWAYSPASVGFWIAVDGQVLPIGWAFLVCVVVFYGLIPVYLFRVAGVSVLLSDIVRHGQIRMLPFHPDRCGGLRPMGRLGLRNQYGLTVFGINLVTLASVSTVYLGLPDQVYLLIVSAVAAYLLVGPLFFMGPLIPFRSGMLRTKADLMSEVAQRLRVELQRIREQLHSGALTREDEELIDRLRKIGSVIDELPVWPFDSGTLRRFLTVYVLPLISAIVYPYVTLLLEQVIRRR